MALLHGIEHRNSISGWHPAWSTRYKWALPVLLRSCGRVCICLDSWCCSRITVSQSSLYPVMFLNKFSRVLYVIIMYIGICKWMSQRLSYPPSYWLLLLDPISLRYISPSLLKSHVIYSLTRGYSIQSTNVYEEKSLGVYEPDDEDVEPSQEGSKFSVWGRYAAFHARKQLAFGNYYQTTKYILALI